MDSALSLTVTDTGSAIVKGRFLIVAGSIKICVMKEILMTTADDEDDDISFVLCFERFNEDGSIPNDPIAKCHLKHSIIDMRRRTNDFEKLTVLYS
ncbi:hypothetical protein PRIPAC_92033 [Pristionchus pacificus]|uniref:Uncharacterized protein n=1 Tax=Pristionchus pacificus TaxID=54126 RepID=A0A2A6BP78_PRIPA|nr:hypothetical protein PRIPAC_92033 [Pristionchus pacificus]|eukprot:PDM67720.1 hypothetical protein PRIPAC_45764 [Pristionchus pacificus]